MSAPLTLLATAIVTLMCVTTTTATYGSGVLPGRMRLSTADYDAFYDFSYENQTHQTEGVTVFERFNYSGCSTKGVLKIKVSDPYDFRYNRRRVLIDLIFTSPSGWAFNLGDSPTNRGSGGDQGSYSNDAELVFNHGFVTAYLNENAGNRRKFRLNNLFRTRLTLIAGDRHVVWFPDDSRLSNYFYNENFFALNNQADTEGSVNNDLYLGVNKVIEHGSFRTGSGLCAIGIKYLPAR